MKRTIVTKPCIRCGERTQMILDAKDVTKWLDGAYVQDAFPYLPPSDRELLITGTHPECWNEMFGGDDD